MNFTFVPRGTIVTNPTGSRYLGSHLLEPSPPFVPRGTFVFESFTAYMIGETFIGDFNSKR
jgi:hypothetical protein